MTEYVWWARSGGTPLDRYAFVINEMGDIPIDHTEERFLDSWKKIWAGDVPTDAETPTSYRNVVQVNKLNRLDKFGRRLPNHFTSGGGFFFTNEFVDVLAELDLGDGFLTPVKMYEFNMRDEINEPAKILIPGNVKACFDFEASKKVIDQMSTPKGRANPYAIKRMGHDWVGVSRHALNGPDIWIDPNFRDALFFSDRAAQVIRDASLTEDIDLRRARVV